MSTRENQPNIVWLITDQQTANAMSCTGNAWLRTPAMDRLAARGTRFERAYCTYPLCTPARGSLLTGQYPHQIDCNSNTPAKGGQFFWYRDFPREHTVTHYLSRNGYRCVWAGKDMPPEDGSCGVDLLCPWGDTQVGDHLVDFIAAEHPTPFLAVGAFVNPHNICEWARQSTLYEGEVGTPPPLDALPPLPANHAIPEQAPELPGANPLKNGGRAVVMRDLKYSVYRWGRHREQLTNLDDDPGELRNLAGDPVFRDTLLTMRRRLHDWTRQTGDSFEAPGYELISPGAGQREQAQIRQRAVAAARQPAATEFDVRQYGAVGDGVANDAAAFQAAIDACHAAGGGRVLVAGRDAVYRCGTFALKSHVELHVASSATILCSERLDECHIIERSGKQTACFIRADGAAHVAITGMGAIDGNGRGYVTPGRYIHTPRGRRPHTLLLIGCRKVRIENVTFRDGADWSVRLTGCEDVVVHGVTILNDLAMPNCDGIDPDHCRNVRISDCHIETGDDCICIKARQEFPEFGPCENIVVTGCTLVSTSCALMVGIEAQATIRNVVFDSCIIRSSNRGLGVHLSHACDVENIVFSNMIVETRQFEASWWGNAEPIYVVALPEADSRPVGRIRNVRFQNITCRGENGIVVIGGPACNVSGIHFDRVRLEIHKTSKWPAGIQDRRPQEEAPNLGRLERPCPAIYLENAADVVLNDVEVVWDGELPDAYTHALEAVNVQALRYEGLRGTAAHPARDAAVKIVEGSEREAL